MLANAFQYLGLLHSLCLVRSFFGNYRKEIWSFSRAAMYDVFVR